MPLDMASQSCDTTPGDPCRLPHWLKNFDRIERHHRPLLNDD